MDFVTHFYDNPAYPNNTYTVAHPTFDDHSRIIAISDIHGNLPYFRGLVEKLHLRADDSLVLLGDLVEKGPESLATLRYAMALREKCRVFPVLGNCDFWHLWVDGCDMEWDVRTFAHLLRQKATARSGLILEMCAELGEVLSPDTDLAALKALLREAFAPEFEYLRAMPFALESDKYIFVHGGIPHGETLESAGPWRCMKINSFYAARPHFKKWVITGHTPVCLYGANTISAVPRARLIWLSSAFTSGLTAAMALPPQIAVPLAIRYEVFLSTVSFRPRNAPRVRVRAMLKTVSRTPFPPACMALSAWMPKRGSVSWMSANVQP